MPKVVQVIESSRERGDGTKGNPTRIVIQYHSLKGELLAERDSIVHPTPYEETAQCKEFSLIND